MLRNGHVERRLLEGVAAVLLVLFRRWSRCWRVILLAILESLANVLKWQALLLTSVVVVVLVIKFHILLLLTALLENKRVLKERIVLHHYWTMWNLVMLHGLNKREAAGGDSAVRARA